MPKSLPTPFLLVVALSFPITASALSPEEVFAKASPSVVMVFASDKPNSSTMQGSGVIVGRDKVITNCHVTQRKDRTSRSDIVIKQGGKVLPASLVAGNTEYDTCLLVVPRMSGYPISIANTANLRIGQRVYAIGAPSGLELTLTDGLLSGLRIKGESTVIQTSAAISPGSSGGGLFDEQGNLIGITSFGIGTGTGLNFAYLADPILGLVKLADRIAANAKVEGQERLPLSSASARAPASSFPDESAAHIWLATMSQRLERRMPSEEYRIEFLRVIHYEATRAGLDPTLILSLVDVVSDFRKYDVSSNGAKGYMHVMPAWVGLIGRPDDNLFHLRTNLRYGCTILRHYLDIESGDLFRALARYENAMTNGPGAEIAAHPNSRFPDKVRTTWQTRWVI